MFNTNYQNKIFENEVVELDGQTFKNCQFRDCMIILKRGDTEIKSCQFIGCKLILKDNALNIGKLIKTFSGDGPLKVVDFNEKGMFQPFEKDNNG